MTEWEVTEPVTIQQWLSYYKLRWQLLRQPFSQPIGSEKDTLEAFSTQRMVLFGNQVIGVGRLHQVNPATAQIRYMAVAEDFQATGVGSAILRSLESSLKQSDTQKIILHSRKSATEFYEKNGYEIVKASHCLYGEIEHYLMQKKIDTT